MKKITLLTFMLFMTLTNLSAQTTASVKAVNNAVERLRLAMISGNRAELNAIASDKLTYGHSSGKIETKAEFVESLATKKSDFVSITLSNQTVDIEGNTAVVRHVLDADTNDGGVAGKAHIGIVLVYSKVKSGWILVARQAVKLAQ